MCHRACFLPNRGAGGFYLRPAHLTLGAGKRLYPDGARAAFRLTGTKTYPSGVVGLDYERAGPDLVDWRDSARAPNVGHADEEEPKCKGKGKGEG
jgi:hypothetical protein